MTDAEFLTELGDWYAEDDHDVETAQRLIAIAVKVNSYDNLKLTISEDGEQFAYHGRMVTA